MAYASRSSRLWPMNRDTLWLLSPWLTWECHAVMSPPLQRLLHLVSPAHTSLSQNDLIAGEVRAGAIEIVQITPRPSTHRVGHRGLVTRLLVGDDKDTIMHSECQPLQGSLSQGRPP